jgi:hypothetical protein
VLLTRRLHQTSIVRANGVSVPLAGWRWLPYETWRMGLGHLLRSFANAKATQGISGKSQFNKSLGTKLPKGQIRAPLNNSKKQLVFPGLGFQASAGPIYAAHDRFF